MVFSLSTFLCLCFSMFLLISSSLYLFVSLLQQPSSSMPPCQLLLHNKLSNCRARKTERGREENWKIRWREQIWRYTDKGEIFKKARSRVFWWSTVPSEAIISRKDVNFLCFCPNTPLFLSPSLKLNFLKLFFNTSSSFSRTNRSRSWSKATGGIGFLAALSTQWKILPAASWITVWQTFIFYLSPSTP